MENIPKDDRGIVMETKFNFNSQICTTREQSERLLVLNLKKETADMTIHIKNDDSWYVTAEPFYEWEDDMNTLPSLEETEQILPAWSLNRLIKMALRFVLICGISFTFDEDAYEKVIGIIEYQIKGGYFNKEYLL